MTLDAFQPDFHEALLSYVVKCEILVLHTEQNTPQNIPHWAASGLKGSLHVFLMLQYSCFGFVCNNIVSSAFVYHFLINFVSMFNAL